MGMRNYYFLVAGLPDISIDQGKLQFGSVEFREYLKSQLSKKDYELIEWLYLPSDNNNLISLINKTTDNNWDDRGLYSIEELELAIAEVTNPDKLLLDEPSRMKSYFFDFLKLYYDEAYSNDSASPLSVLSTFYYRDALQLKNDFFKNWFEFDINLKNVLLYNAARKFNTSYENELIGDTSLVNALRSKTGRDVGEAAEWAYFERANQISENNDIANREKAIDLLRWSVLDEMNIFNYFSIEVIISYTIKILMIERWLKLDPKTGEELFRRLIGDLQSNYEFPNEFSIKDGKK